MTKIEEMALQIVLAEISARGGLGIILHVDPQQDSKLQMSYLASRSVDMAFAIQNEAAKAELATLDKPRVAVRLSCASQTR